MDLKPTVFIHRLDAKCERESGMTLRVCGGAAGRVVCPLLWWGRPTRVMEKLHLPGRALSALPIFQKLSRDVHRRCAQLSWSDGFSAAITFFLISWKSFTPSLQPLLSALPQYFLTAARSPEMHDIRHIYFILRHSWENTQEIKVVLI